LPLSQLDSTLNYKTDRKDEEEKKDAGPEKD